MIWVKIQVKRRLLVEQCVYLETDNKHALRQNLCCKVEWIVTTFALPSKLYYPIIIPQFGLFINANQSLMKNILVPTDFSENANHALEFAIAIAQQFDATIHLIHAYHVTSHAGHLANVVRVVREDRAKELAELMGSLEARNLGIQIEGRAKKGHPNQVMEDEVKKMEVDLVVMGTLGASNLGEKLLGSTTSNLIKNLQVPLLAVPKDALFRNLSGVVVALDALSMPTPSALNPMISIASKRALNIKLVHVSGDTVHTDIDPIIYEYLDEVAVKYSYEKVQANDPLEGILSASDAGSMLCLVARQRGWFERLFHSSMSQKVALHAQVPLLILQDN